MSGRRWTAGVGRRPAGGNGGGGEQRFNPGGGGPPGVGARPGTGSPGRYRREGADKHRYQQHITHGKCPSVHVIIESGTDQTAPRAPASATGRRILRDIHTQTQTTSLTPRIEHLARVGGRSTPPAPPAGRRATMKRNKIRCQPPPHRTTGPPRPCAGARRAGASGRACFLYTHAAPWPFMVRVAPPSGHGDDQRDAAGGLVGHDGAAHGP